MTTSEQQQLSDALEALIDKHNLTIVLSAIQEICNLKAEHLETNWQDGPTAKVWGKAGQIVGKAWCKIDDMGL